MGFIMTDFFVPEPSEQWFPDGRPTEQTFNALRESVNISGIISLGAIPNVLFEDLANIDEIIPNPVEGWTIWVKNQTLPIEQAIFFGGQWVSTIDGATPIV